MTSLPIKSQIGNQAEEANQLDMVQKLRSHIDDRHVFDGLCNMAVSPVGAKVREAILTVLQPAADSAGRWFVRVAGLSDNKLRRRLALVNLSLMECTLPEAREVVLQGLADSDQDIQHAAVLSAGLFNDREFLAAVDLFLDRNRFVLVGTSVHYTTFKADRRSDHAKEPQSV